MVSSIVPMGGTGDENLLATKNDPESGAMLRGKFSSLNPKYIKPRTGSGIDARHYPEQPDSRTTRSTWTVAPPRLRKNYYLIDNE